MGSSKTDNRFIRERNFHDIVFSENKHSREKMAPYYKLMEPANIKYHSILDRHVKNSHILEYGCGKGESALIWARKGAKITGIDISEAGIDYARNNFIRNGIKPDFHVMNAENLDFENDSFDIVTGKGILHHLNLEKAYSEISRVLKKNGQGIFIEPLSHNIFINLYRKITPNLRTPDEKPLTLNDILSAENYFYDVSFFSYNLFSLITIPFLKHNDCSFGLNFFHNFDRAVFRIFPTFKKYSWMVLLEFKRPAI
jgi:ubiquinone/menaquinone biosynthesis C-methylase UbiE